jgi:hypothetical protein
MRVTQVVYNRDRRLASPRLASPLLCSVCVYASRNDSPSDGPLESLPAVQQVFSRFTAYED